MVNYSHLSRKMNSEIRVSCRKLVIISVSLLVLFIYVLSKSSCESSGSSNARISVDDGEVSPVIYAVSDELEQCFLETVQI